MLNVYVKDLFFLDKPSLTMSQTVDIIKFIKTNLTDKNQGPSDYFRVYDQVYNRF